MATRIRAKARQVEHSEGVERDGSVCHVWSYVDKYYIATGDAGEDRGDLEVLWACPCGSFLKTRIEDYHRVDVPYGVTWEGDAATWIQHQVDGGSLWHEPAASCAYCETKS